MLHAIPVKRPQDYTFIGTGQVKCYNGQVQGLNTRFTQEVRPGDSIKSQSHTFTIKSVESDTELTVNTQDSQLLLSPFKVLPKIDQSIIYDTVHSQLKMGKCIGIFPEGGSHDRTTPLPLKAGVCLMALGAMARHNITVTIQCIGLNYYHGHRFRSKAVINFGVPYTIPRELATLYLQDRNKAVEILLKQIETVRYI
jgi:glycerol-3-phosphate O-acyltransferase/dihydroxyacetone phosphate acyltransferase